MNNSRILSTTAVLILSAELFNAVQRGPTRSSTSAEFATPAAPERRPGVLTLVDFYDDDNGMLTDDVFISFEYTSSSRSFVITRADGGSAGGTLNIDGSVPAVMSISSSTGLPSFTASQYGFDAAAMGDDTDDVGASYQFILIKGAIPEPPTWAMMLVGFAGLGLAGVRKARRAIARRT